MDSSVGSALGLSEWGSRFESVHRQSSFFEFLSLCKIVVLHHRIKGVGKLQKDFFTRKLTEPPGTVTSLM